jgi:N-acetylmuramoyl-L-alanine amidase
MPYDPGAVAPDGTTERKWCEALHDLIVPRLTVPFVTIEDFYANLPARANATRAQYFISLHLNSSEDPTSNGTEVLHWHTSTAGQREARRFASAIAKALGTRLRFDHTGALPRNHTHRGGGLLQKTTAVALMVESFFISNPKELAHATANRAALAAAIAHTINTLPRP